MSMRETIAEECDRDREAFERGRAQGRVEERAEVLAMGCEACGILMSLRGRCRAIERGDHATEHRDALTRRLAEAEERGRKKGWGEERARILNKSVRHQFEASNRVKVVERIVFVKDLPECLIDDVRDIFEGKP